MSVSIADMERVALGGDGLRMGDDIGNVIELGDLSDDLGLSMLMNPSKMSNQGGGGGGGQSRTVNFPPPQQQQQQQPQQQQFQVNYNGGNGSLGGIEVSPLEPMEPISIGGYENIGSVDMNNFGGPPIDVSVNNSNQGQGSFGGLFGNSQSATGPGVQLASPMRDPEAEKKEKTDYLNKLQRLEAKGFPVSRKYTMDNSLEEVKTEYFRLVDARQLETSIKFQRQMLVGAITGMEWLNGRFDPFDVKLDGWSESVHENVEDFDEIFEELYDKYKDRGKMSPEMRLVMAVGGSGFMCHVSNTFFRSKMPSMDDVLKKNPELARQMAAAAASQAGPGFGNFMGMAMGVPQQQQQQDPSASASASASASVPSSPVGAFFGASAASPGPPTYAQMMQPQVVLQQQATQRPTARREMAGPSGVDDILKTFDEVRRAEMAAATFQPATGVLTQPAVAAAMSSSLSATDDLQSQAESARTGATGTLRPRRRRAQPPVGNTVSLDA
jgi:hypothetical protein